jgi:outer membrane protein TolC
VTVRRKKRRLVPRHNRADFLFGTAANCKSAPGNEGSKAMKMKIRSRTCRRRHPAAEYRNRLARSLCAFVPDSLLSPRVGVVLMAGALAFTYVIALRGRVNAQAMPGTMTVPGTPATAPGAPAAVPGAPPSSPLGPVTGVAPTAPETVGPHISYSANPLITNQGEVKLKSTPVGKQETPDVVVSPSETNVLEHTPPAPDVVLHQWSFTREIPEESIFSRAYMLTRDQQARSISLKEALYLALRNNPGIVASSLEPVISLQGVRGSWAVFDPDLTGQLGEEKIDTPTTSSLQTGGAKTFVQKQYIWDFAVNKTLATTNGVLGATFTNNYFWSNSAFAGVNPAYSPALELSLDQPLLRNFGNQFATINVRIAESGQKQAQFNYEQQLNDFVLRVGTDYWNVVRAEENLEVARRALAVAQDLVRQNTISVKVGVLAPLSLKEAQSEEATDLSNVYQAEGALETARTVLAQDVMYNPDHTFLPANLEPVERPNPRELGINDEESLEHAMMYRPELASMRELIRSDLLQVKYSENQTLPQVNIGAQFGITAVSGATICNPIFAASALHIVSNCTVQLPGPVSTPGIRLPFKGLYPDALNRMFDFAFYNYAVVFNLERPLNNDAAKSALAQAKIAYEQQRLRYRDLISSIVVDVQSSLNGLKANYKSAQAAKTATQFAAASLHDERERFRVGMATTHELLQFIDSLVAAEGNEVNADVNFEVSKLQVRHAEGTLLRAFNIQFVPANPDVRPWYGRF